MFFVQCQNQDSNNKLEKTKEDLPELAFKDTENFELFLKDSFNVELANYNYILYYTSMGCAGCNNRYFNVLNKNIFKQDVLTVFSGDESDFDFNQIRLDKENQIIDKKKKLLNFSFLQLPCIIEIDSCKIDTVYAVDVTFTQFDSIISSLLVNKSILYE
ncbi:MAG: hypothetical protein M0Q45_03685 [Bacteroidales bacterium]|jgi:hypothetical protein|nr:hypothetical protein [Bacteroidales bacterium]